MKNQRASVLAERCAASAGQLDIVKHGIQHPPRRRAGALTQARTFQGPLNVRRQIARCPPDQFQQTGAPLGKGFSHQDDPNAVDPDAAPVAARVEGLAWAPVAADHRAVQAWGLEEAVAADRRNAADPAGTKTAAVAECIPPIKHMPPNQAQKSGLKISQPNSLQLYA